MEQHTSHWARALGSRLRLTLSLAASAALALTIAIPPELASAGFVGGVGGAVPAADAGLVTQVGNKGKGGGGKHGGGGNWGGGGNRAVVVRGGGGGGGRPGRNAYAYRGGQFKGQKKNVYVNRTVVNRTVINRTYVNRNVVVRPVRGWYRRPYYGNFVSGVALGTILAVGAVGIAPVAPAPNLCWYWSDPAMINGYWDYCY